MGFGQRRGACSIWLFSGSSDLTMLEEGQWVDRLALKPPQNSLHKLKDSFS